MTDFAAVLGPQKVSVDPETRQKYGRDWTTYFDIQTPAVFFPENTPDVVRLVQWARGQKISLVPSGGRTGLSGAACATQGEVIVSFEKMNKIRQFNSIDQTVVCESGVITEELQNFAHAKNLYFPVDFASRGSSQVGGNVATNAGGIKVVRYGMTRDWVAGLKVVIGTGEVLDLGKSLIKNATGYDLRHLFIGSEGTLGFITEVTFRLASAPPPLQVMILAVPRLVDLMKVYAEFKTKLSLVAFEMLSDKALTHVMSNSHLPPPLGEKSPYYVVAEVEKRSADQEEMIISLFESCIEEGWVTDGALAQSESQAKNFWRYREDISESLSKHSPYKNDVSVAISEVPAFMQDLDAVLKPAYPNWEVVWFGHIGDGNLHINILKPPGTSRDTFLQECHKVDKMVFATVQKYRGSISAEHGVGLTKKGFLGFSRSAAEIEIMRGIKKVFDPDGIINPGKLF